MFGRKLMTVGFGLALLSDVSCSRPLCDVNPDDSRCDSEKMDMDSNSSITISPLRLHYKSGGTVAITGINPGAAVSLVQKTVSQNFGSAPSNLSNTMWSAPVSNLQGFSPGMATLNISQSGKIISKPIRLFATSTFEESNESTYKTGSPSTINWLGVGGQSVFTLNSFTASTLRAVYVYQYSTPNNGLNVMTQPISSNLPSYAKAATTAGAIIELRVSTDGQNNRVFQTCPYGMTGCADTPQIVVSSSTTYQDIDVVADPLGKFFAFMTIPTGMTAPKLSALKIENMLPTSQAAALQGSKLNNDMTIKSLTTGDFDGDGKTDLAAWHSTPANAIEIFIQQSDGSFKFDEASSGKLQNAIGSTPVLAISAGDLDADGLADITLARASKVVVKITNLGNGFVADPTPLPVPGTTLSTIDGIALGDVGGPKLENTLDATDIVIASKAQLGLAVLINTLM